MSAETARMIGGLEEDRMMVGGCTGAGTGTGTGSPTQLFIVPAEGSGLQADMETDISLDVIGSRGTGTSDDASIRASFRLGTWSQRCGRRIACQTPARRIVIGCQ